MTVGTRTFEGLAVPLSGECEIVQETAATDIITLTGAASQTGDFLVLRNSSGTEMLYINASGGLSLASYINKMVLGTIALASLASNASATATLTGITTNHLVTIFARGAQTSPLPVVWANSANVLGYGAPGVACAAQTVSYWMFSTA